MANQYIPRERVHALSEKIAAEPDTQQSALRRLLRNQRRLTKFIQENQQDLNPETRGVAIYLVGVVIRIFDLIGGRMKSANWDAVRSASARVHDALPLLSPLDSKFPKRLRTIEWRAQPHILDEALMALFDRKPGQEEEDLNAEEATKVFMLMWVATEVLNEAWTPPARFDGEDTYTYVHIEASNNQESES